MQVRRRWLRAFAAIVTIAFVGAAVTVTASPAVAAGEARLSLFKRIENLDSGSSVGDRSLWDVQAVNVDTGEVIRDQGLNGIQSRPVPAGTYEISEIERADTPPGYRFVQWECGGDITTDPVRTITLAENQQLTCTVENEAIEPTLTLHKDVVGGSAPPSAWTLAAMDGPTNVQGPGNSAEVTNVRVRIGHYRLQESGGPDGYTAGTWTCTTTDHLGNTGTLPVAADGGIDLDLDQFVTCSITNSASLPQLTLVKSVTGPAGMPLHDPTAWTLSATGQGGANDVISGPTGSLAVTHAGVDPGDYLLEETGPAGYLAGAWSCVDQTNGTPVAVSNGTVAVGAEADVRCDIVNDFEGGWLTLVKTVVDSDQPPTDWTLSATGAVATASGVTGSPGVTRVPVPAGTYALAESGPTAGYTTQGWQCTGSTAFVTEVVVAAGAEIACTIENDRTSAHLTLVKAVVNSGGGPLAGTDWTLAADGSTGFEFDGATGTEAVSFVAVPTGTYTLSESSSEPEASGYLAGDWVCVDDLTDEQVSTGPVVDLPSEESAVTCTITNRWQGSTLTLEKEVAAPIGPGAPGSAWTLTATAQAGGAVISGASGSPAVTRAPVPGGSVWSLAEADGPAGYQQFGWACTGASVTSDGVATVPAGSDAHCTVLNAAILPTLTLVKDVVNEPGGGTATDSEFMLKARGPGNAAFAGVEGTAEVTNLSVPPGQYVFSEDGPGGYEGTWSCAGTTWDGRSAFVQYGETVVCTATNSAVPPTLALDKVVDGGDADASDWVLTAVGPGSVEGEAPVASTVVDQGVYRLGERPSPAAGAATDGYVAGEWSCTGSGFAPADLVQTGPGAADLVLSLGDEVACTVVNRFETAPPVTPTPTPSPVPVPPAGGGGLPATGVDPAAWLAVAVGAVVAGLGLVLLIRRRQSSVRRSRTPSARR
ncbi:LPXTG cell wall anchor domain-containing protein [Agromyces sp. NPDC056965]|uniref:LPXTG cell wall anchor domain-containing protein n=1 Tax=Agromyces sp. NPDC056965 TaxID=3345983 RepID=UPI0036286837